MDENITFTFLCISFGKMISFSNEMPIHSECKQSLNLKKKLQYCPRYEELLQSNLSKKVFTKHIIVHTEVEKRNGPFSFAVGEKLIGN